jgi:large subunit ribosomal protein L14
LVYVGSLVSVVDNSGVRLVRRIKVLGCSNQRVRARVGNLIVGAVQRAPPGRKIKVHSIRKCVLIRQRFVTQRRTGLYVSLHKPAAVVVDIRKQPVATRIKGSAMNELRKKKFMKVIPLCSSLI